MLRIGEFSRLSTTPVSALRYYDEIGLLRPVEVDRFTGYRYYSAQQLSRLNRINALKDLGLSLAEVVQLTGEDEQDACLGPLLERKAEEIRRGIADEQGRLTRLNAWLEHLRTRGEMDTTSYEVVIKKVVPLQAMCLRRVMPGYQSEGDLWGELCGYLGQQKGVRYVGPPLTLCHDGEYKERDVDIELAVPVESPVKEYGDIRFRTLPGHEQVASVIHKGPFNTVNHAYQFLLGWMERNGYKMDGPDRTVYLNTPEQAAPADLLKEVQIPITRA
ncbi:MAG: MerR family transcriptional regulator [Dehalococcoidia bacterium]|jgi:effector-binding domain-containing protein|nr:MerR family transcriptional regulator [Dehalococcoidia bacterium]